MNHNFITTLLVDQSPEEVFQAINDIPAWWSTDFEGQSGKLNDVFTVRFGETFITLKVVEWIPCEKLVWHVTDCKKHWLKNKKEWKDTTIAWEIAEKDNRTEILFTHHGLVSQLECYDVCINAWDQYLKGSLFKLISEGEGIPS